jgi:hypothetical protein
MKEGHFLLFERIIFRMICGPTNENGIVEKKIQYKLYTFYDELDTHKVIKTGILRWPGYLFRMQEMILAESLLFLNKNTFDV